MRVNELETTTRVLERESRQSESSSSAMIDELHAKMDECTRNYAMLEQERDIIKAEYAKVKENLQRGICKALKAQHAELKTIATETHNELEKYIRRHDETKTNLDEKSLLASDIHERNTQLQKDLSSKESFISELQERWRSHVKESEEIKGRRTQIRIEKEKQINKHIDALQEERLQQKQLESEIAILKAKLTKTKKNPTSASDATESSTTTALSDASPNDSIPNSSISNEPEEETFLRFGRKMTWEQIQNLSNNPKLRDQFEKSSKIYYEMKHSPSSTYSFFESKRRKQCRKVPVPELDSESILLYEPIAAHMRSQNLFENELAREHFEDPIYVMFVNWIFEVLGFIGTPPLLFGNTNLSLADFIGIFRLTFSITKVQDYQKHHTFVEFMKLVESLAATTGANIAWVVQDSDPLGKNGLWSSWFTDKILENDPGLKELVDLYKKVVELYQKCALPISIRIIKNMIQKNKVSGNKENKETENLGEEGAKYFMVEAQSGKYLKYFPDCCKQASAVYMHSFKNGNADMKKIQAYHPSTQNNGYDGKANGLITLGLFHRAYFVYLSILSIIHRQNFNDIFVNKNGEFDFKRLLKDAGVSGVKGGKPALVSKDTGIFFRKVASDTISPLLFLKFLCHVHA